LARLNVWEGSTSGVAEMDETLVPAHPVVEIEVTPEAVTVDGVVVDRGSTGGPDDTVAMHLGVHAAARQVAQPLGRPVRAILRCGGDEKRMIIHPDGNVSNVEDTFEVVSLVAPAGARGVPASRHARRPRGLLALRARRTRLVMGTAYGALVAVLVGGVLMTAVDGDDPAPSASRTDEEPSTQATPTGDPAPPAAVPAVVEGTRLDRLPGVSDVVVTPESGGFRVLVTTGRAGRVTVRAEPVSGDDAARVWTIRTFKATTRTLDADDLAAGAYRWTVRSPGERSVTGRVVVPAPPATPTVVPVGSTTVPAPSSTTDNPAPSRDNDGGDGGRDGRAGGGEQDSRLVGPTKPVDPDDPMAR
jgi:hypothetical protein